VIILSFDGEKERKEETLESLRSEIEQLKKEIKHLHDSKDDFDDDDFFDDKIKEKTRRAKRKMRKHRHRRHNYSGFGGLEHLGRFINQVVCTSVDGLNESIESVVEGVMDTVTTVLDNIDFDEIFEDADIYIRRKPRRWRYGEEPPTNSDESVDKPKIFLDEKEKIVLNKLTNEKFTFTQLSESSGISESDLENLLKYLKENELVIQETSGLQRFFITKYGKEHLTGEM
jgi:predicted transcriptional regulator